MGMCPSGFLLVALMRYLAAGAWMHDAIDMIMMKMIWKNGIATVSSKSDPYTLLLFTSICRVFIHVLYD